VLETPAFSLTLFFGLWTRHRQQFTEYGFCLVLLNYNRLDAVWDWAVYA
jgi:hypothetical protein